MTNQELNSFDTSRTQVRAFIHELLSDKIDKNTFSDGDSLLQSGGLDSLGVVEIVNFLEQNFGVDLSDLGFDATNFENINSIMSLITQSESARK